MKVSSILSSGLIAAILSSLCCITPVLALVAGMSGVAASFSWLEPGRPYLAGITIAVLGFAWYKKVFPKTESPDCACETEGKNVSFWHTKTFLTLITIFALSTLAFPYYAHIFYPHPEKQVIVANENDFRSVEFKINGMTCQGCAEHVMFEVNKLAGIITTNASFEKGNALVEFDESKVSQDSIESAINSTGYRVVDVVKLR